GSFYPPDPSTGRGLRVNDPFDLYYVGDDGDWYYKSCIDVFVTTGERVQLDL
ncbi:hypothetical protein GOP47_0019740, partial [Adiantum capillus-veneris]